MGVWEDPRPGTRILGSTTGGCGENPRKQQDMFFTDAQGRARCRSFLRKQGVGRAQRVQNAGRAKGDRRRMLRQSFVG